MASLPFTLRLITFADFVSSSKQLRWLVSVFAGIIMCKIIYKITGLVSFLYFKGYAKLNKEMKIEWNNRGLSTFHAVIVAVASLYLLQFSDLFVDGSHDELIINKTSPLADIILGSSGPLLGKLFLLTHRPEAPVVSEREWAIHIPFDSKTRLKTKQRFYWFFFPLICMWNAPVLLLKISIGYFLSDLAMIIWQFPALGGFEYILHHGLSMFSIFLSLVSGQGQIYILMVLFSESTTPFVNLRWYLDIYGQKSSKLYICNGILLFLGWLVARILLFIFFFVHMYIHFDQVKKVFPLGFYSLLVVPPILTVMNIFWFWKIVKGLIKTLSKARHTH